MDQTWVEFLRDLEQVRAIAPRLSTIEVRADADDDGPGVLTGHFAVFDAWYEIDSFFEGHFLERVAPGAFKRTFNAYWDSGDPHRIQVMLEHGLDPTVGEKPLGVPSVLREDGKGAFYEVDLFDAAYVRDLVPALRSGVYGASFRFRVMHDEWVKKPGESEHNPDGIPERTVKEVRTREFGPTVFPASPSATAGMRSQTDEFYERLRSRDPATYDSLLARAREIRTPDTPGEPARIAGTSPEPGPATPPADDPPPARHSEVIHVHPATPKEKMMAEETMTVEERAARQSEIRARLAEIDSEHAGAVLPEDVRSEWDDLQQEYRDHQEAIDEQEERRAVLANVNPPERGESGSEPDDSRRRAPAVRTATDPYDLAAVRQRARSVDDLPALYRDNAMRAIETAKFPGASRMHGRNKEDAQEHVRHLLDEVDDDNGSLARRILVTGSPTYQRAFGKAAMALSTNGLNAEEQRALSLGTDAAGGFAVPFDLDPTVILTSDGVTNPLRSLARVEQTMGKEWQGVTSAGITVTRHPEAGEANDDSPTLAQPSVATTRVQGFVPFSIELDASWSALASEITRLLNDAKETEEAGSFLNGDGTGNNPSGLIATLNASSNVDTASVNAFATADVYALEEALPPRFLARAQFLGHRSVFNKVRQFDTQGGADMWVRLAAGQPPELIGYPAHRASEMAAFATTTGTKLLLFGDFSQFLIVDRIGMSVELVPHLFGANRRPTGQRGIYAIWSNSSLILVDNAFRLLVVDGA